MSEQRSEKQLIASPDDGERYRAVYRYVTEGPGTDLPALLSLLGHPADRIVSSVLSVIWHIPEPSFIPGVRALFSRENMKLRWKAVGVLKRLQDVEGLWTVAGARGIEEPIYLAALTALAELEDVRVLPVLSRIAREGDGWQAAKALQLLAQRQPHDAAEIALHRAKMLQHPSWKLILTDPVARVIMWLLSESSCALPSTEWHTLFGHPEISSEWKMLNEVNQRAAACDFDALLAFMNEPGFDRIVLEALIRIDRDRALSHVMDALGTPEKRVMAVHLIQDHGYRHLAPVIEEYIDDPQGAYETVRASALEAIVSLRGADALPLVRRSLGHTHLSVRLEALTQIKQLDDRESRDTLIQLMAEGSDESIVHLAAFILAEWEVPEAKALILRRLGLNPSSALLKYLASLDRDEALSWLRSHPELRYDRLSGTCWNNSYSRLALELGDPESIQIAFRELAMIPDTDDRLLRALLLCRMGIRADMDLWPSLGRAHAADWGIDVKACDRIECLAECAAAEAVPILLEWATDRGLEPAFMDHPVEPEDVRAAAIKALIHLEPHRRRDYQGTWFYGLFAGDRRSRYLHCHLHFGQCC